jgi:hypothetical protein
VIFDTDVHGKAGLTRDKMDVIENNEALCAQAVAVTLRLDFDTKKTNPNGLRHCAGPRNWRFRCLHVRQGELRTAQHRRQVCAAGDVHRRRAGHRAAVRAAPTFSRRRVRAAPRAVLSQMIHDMFFLNVLLQVPRIPAGMTPPSPDGNNQE